MELLKYLQLLFVLPFYVNAGIFKNLLKEGCDYDRDTSTYICVKITNRFKKLYDGAYHLQCHYCDMEAFTNETLSHKNQLRTFNVSDSKIKKIFPYAFGHLKYLEEMHLENNEISEIAPNAFYGLRRLLELHLGNNAIDELVPGVFNECEANGIFLNNNNLVQLKNEVFRGLYGILVLDISYNSIKTLEPDSLKYLPGLEVLDLEYNELCSLPIGVFKYVKNVRKLNLAHNRFSSFPLGLFSPFGDLKSLNISHNQLKVFESKVFLPLMNIERLDISANLLYVLDVVALKQYLPTLKWLVLNDNFWTCNHLTFIIQYLRNNGVEISDYGGEQRFDLTNINGIACTESDVEDNVTLTKFLETAKAVIANKRYCLLE